MSNRGAWVNAAVRAVLLFGFAAYITHLVKTDHILYYVSPRMALYVKLAAIGLHAVAAYEMYAAFAAYSGRRIECDCGHDHGDDGPAWKRALLYGLFAVPLLLGFGMPDTALDSTLAAKLGMNLDGAAAVKSETARPNGQPTASEVQLESLFPSNPLTADYAKLARSLYPLERIAVPEGLYIETLTTLELYVDRFAGKQVTFSGFVYRDDTMDDRHFAVGRFSVPCCSADAAPFGVLVRSDRAGDYAPDQWVEVTGTIGKAEVEGAELMVVSAERIAAIAAPKEPYVHPNEQFGS